MTRPNSDEPRFSASHIPTELLAAASADMIPNDQMGSRMEADEA